MMPTDNFKLPFNPTLQSSLAEAARLWEPSASGRQPVSSSNLRSVGYDAARRVLTIEFHSGSVYEYSAVPPEVHEGLMGAGSHGKYHHAHIRNSYGYRRVS